MNTLKAKEHAEQMIWVYLGSGWKFKWDLRADRFGTCQHDSKVITLSSPYVLMNQEAYVHEALMHEIAHAMTGDQDHGLGWWKTNLQLGGTGNAYIRKEVMRPVRASFESIRS